MNYEFSHTTLIPLGFLLPIEEPGGIPININGSYMGHIDRRRDPTASEIHLSLDEHHEYFIKPWSVNATELMTWQHWKRCILKIS